MLTRSDIDRVALGNDPNRPRWGESPFRGFSLIRAWLGNKENPGLGDGPSGRTWIA